MRRRLAIGGMGELFLVDRTTGDGVTSTAVLKRLLPGADPAHQALFLREGDALAQLASPRIVRLLDRGPGWLLLEHVDGVDLATLLAQRARRGRPLPLPAAMAALTGLAAALADLHEAAGPDGAPLGLVHRDVNPANVLLTMGGAVKLIDLGVVRTALTDAATVAGVKGTLAYMAPEQLHG
ncbi:MAG: protein kinase, partial [Deltaproteobacteria bacterium HGW-Deltaproteobacteria-14]